MGTPARPLFVLCFAKKRRRQTKQDGQECPSYGTRAARLRTLRSLRSGPRSWPGNGAPVHATCRRTETPVRGRGPPAPRFARRGRSAPHRAWTTRPDRRTCRASTKHPRPASRCRSCPARRRRPSDGEARRGTKLGSHEPPCAPTASCRMGTPARPLLVFCFAMTRRRQTKTDGQKCPSYKTRERSPPTHSTTTRTTPPPAHRRPIRVRQTTAVILRGRSENCCRRNRRHSRRRGADVRPASPTGGSPC